MIDSEILCQTYFQSCDSSVCSRDSILCLVPYDKIVSVYFLESESYFESLGSAKRLSNPSLLDMFHYATERKCSINRKV